MVEESSFQLCTGTTYCTGATNIDAHLPFPVDHLGEETRKSYLDITGRPVVVINKKNVVAHHQVDFSVSVMTFGDYSNAISARKI